MGNILNIFGGPAQVHIYDATNGYLSLGFNEEVMLEREPLTHALMDGNLLEYSRLTKLEVPLLQSDPTMISAITDRRGVKQTVYLTGMEHQVIISNVYVSLGVNRNYKPGEAHKLVLTAQTKIDADLQTLVNLLGDYGGMDTDTNADGVSDGWTVTGTPANLARSTSFLGASYGSHQNLEIDDLGQGIYCDVICPLDGPVRVTASAYVKGATAGTHYFNFGFKTKNSSNVVLDDNTEEMTISGTAQSRITKSVYFSPSAGAVKLGVYFDDNGAADPCNINIDQVQLELGAVSEYTENS